MKKLKVLLAGIFYKNFTGSEMYIFELSKNLKKLNCDVSVFSSNLGDPLSSMSKKLGIKILSQLDLTGNENFDIIHCQHKPIVNYLNKVYPNTPKVCTIHSEIIDLESPIFHPSIKRYIAIRESIKQGLIENFNVSEELISLIYNPIDKNKFNTKKTSTNNYVLFVGSFENLRRNPILDLVEYCKNVDKELWLVGTNHSDYLQQIITLPHVKHFPSTENVEFFVKNCYETAGIMMGRTTIEGWMCGKNGWIYEVNDKGTILNKTLHTPPSDIEKFYSNNVANLIINEYYNILK